MSVETGIPFAAFVDLPDEIIETYLDVIDERSAR